MNQSLLILLCVCFFINGTHVWGKESDSESKKTLTVFVGTTPFNNINTPVQVYKFSSRLNHNKWVAGVSVLYGRFQSTLGFADTEWFAMGPYWQLWSTQYGNLSLEFAPTYLNQRYMAGHFVGSRWHFTSALEFTFNKDWQVPLELGLRYQHTSNAGIESPNPGIDGLGMFISYYWY